MFIANEPSHIFEPRGNGKIRYLVIHYSGTKTVSEALQILQGKKGDKKSGRKQQGGFGSMMLFILFIFIVIFLIDFPRLIKKKQFKILAIYCCFYSLALVLSILILLDIPVTSPMVLIDSLLKSINLSY